MSDQYSRPSASAAGVHQPMGVSANLEAEGGGAASFASVTLGDRRGDGEQKGYLSIPDSERYRSRLRHRHLRHREATVGGGERKTVQIRVEQWALKRLMALVHGLSARKSIRPGRRRRDRAELRALIVDGLCWAAGKAFLQAAEVPWRDELATVVSRAGSPFVGAKHSRRLTRGPLICKNKTWTTADSLLKETRWRSSTL